MKQTKLMRILNSRNCSRIFSAKLNKAFDEALENGNSELVDANNELVVATVGNDIVVEDKINDEVTKFTPNPEVENDMVMEAIVDTSEEKVECNKTSRYSRARRARMYSDVEEPVAVEDYQDTPTVGLSSDTHEINTLPEVEVVVNEGVVNDEKSGTIPFSIKFRNIPKSKMYSITRSIRKAFSDECEVEAAENIANQVVNAVEGKLNSIVEEVVNEVKTESKRTRKAFCDGQMGEDTADAIVNAVVNEVKNVIENVVNEVANKSNEEVKNESKRTRKSFADEADNATNEATNEATEVLDEVDDIKNDIKENVVKEVTDELEQLVNDAVIEPQAEITETEEIVNEKTESKKFSANNNSDLSKLLTVKFM